ncbi:MFS transporter [Thermococcus guaymasensis]|uniref:MFS transporter n=1 Tax=Thermococcus guaymasensis TaxID=110164 RepID=UPI000A017971|nr:MFS transporter [Thermococcus guaymasensis]
MKREQTILQGRREKAGKLKKLRVKRKNIIILAVAMFIANMAFGMAFPYLGVYMSLLGASMFMVGLLSVAFNLTSTVFQYPFGWLSDSTGNRRGFIAFGLASTGVFYTAMAFVGSATGVLILRTLQGTFGSAMTPAHSALVSELSTRAGSMFGLFNSIENAGYMVGNFLGSVIVKYVGIRKLFIISGILLFIPAGIVLMIRERSTGKRSILGMILVQEGRESWRATVKSSAFKKLMRGHLGLFYVTVLLLTSSQLRRGFQRVNPSPVAGRFEGFHSNPLKSGSSNPSGRVFPPLPLPWANKPPKFGVMVPTTFFKMLKAPTKSALKTSPVTGHLNNPRTKRAPS